MAELVIKTSAFVSPKFEVTNFEELKVEVQRIANTYGNMLIKEEDIDNAKEIKAKLNKLADNFDTERKKAEKEYTAGFKIGESQIKELVKMIKNASDSINSTLKLFEQNEKNAKKADIQKAFEEICVEHNWDVIPFEKLFKEEYLNKSFSLKKVKQDIESQIEKVNGDLDLLHSMNLGSDIENEVIVEYVTNYTSDSVTLLSTSVSKVKQRKENLSKLQTNHTYETDNRNYTFKLTLTATKAQLTKIVELLKANGIDYKFEKGE